MSLKARHRQRQRPSAIEPSSRTAASKSVPAPGHMSQHSRPQSHNRGLRFIVTLALKQRATGDNLRPLSSSGSSSTSTENERTLDDSFAHIRERMPDTHDPSSHSHILVLFEQPSVAINQPLTSEVDDGLPTKGIFGPAHGTRQSEKEDALFGIGPLSSTTQFLVSSSPHQPALDNDIFSRTDVTGPANLPIGYEGGIMRDNDDVLPGMHGTPLPPILQPLMTPSSQHLFNVNEEGFPYKDVFRPGYPKNFSISGSPLYTRRPDSARNHVGESNPSPVADSSWTPAPAFLEECGTSPTVQPADMASPKPSDQILSTAPINSKLDFTQLNHSHERTSSVRQSRAPKRGQPTKNSCQQEYEENEILQNQVTSIVSINDRSARHRLRNHTKLTRSTKPDPCAPSALVPKAIRNARREYELKLALLTATDRSKSGNHLSPEARSVRADVTNNKKVRKIPPGRKSLGCWTCKLRGKKCDETHPTCQACLKLGIPCDGYSIARPKFMTDPVVKANHKAQIRTTIMTQKRLALQASE